MAVWTQQFFLVFNFSRIFIVTGLVRKDNTSVFLYSCLLLTRTTINHNIKLDIGKTNQNQSEVINFPKISVEY